MNFGVEWMATIDKDIHTEMDRISQLLTQRIKELAERYEKPLSAKIHEMEKLKDKANAHLEKIGFVWR